MSSRSSRAVPNRTRLLPSVQHIMPARRDTSCLNLAARFWTTCPSTIVLRVRLPSRLKLHIRRLPTLHVMTSAKLDSRRGIPSCCRSTAWLLPTISPRCRRTTTAKLDPHGWIPHCRHWIRCLRCHRLWLPYRFTSPRLYGGFDRVGCRLPCCMVILSLGRCLMVLRNWLGRKVGRLRCLIVCCGSTLQRGVVARQVEC